VIATVRGHRADNVIVDALSVGTAGILRITPSGYRYLVSDQIHPHCVTRVVAHLDDHLPEARAVAGVIAVCDREDCPAATAWLPMRCVSVTA
jgi:hypothetical protein